MTGFKAVPEVPAQWFSYIKSQANKYAVGMFSREDAMTVAVMAFLSAKDRFKPGKGLFDRYARVSIRNALLNARRAEQKHWDQREHPDDDRGGGDIAPSWTGEETVLEVLDEKARAGRIVTWAEGLPPKFAPLWNGLYARDMSQRELAIEAGVSQARICQRNGELLAQARTEFGSLLVR